MLEELLITGLYDWVDAAQVMSIAAGEGGNERLLYRDTAFGLIAEALFGGYMLPGSVPGKAFVPWETDPRESFFRIVTTWTNECGDKMPNMGDIVWLDLTDQGESVARSVLAREDE